VHSGELCDIETVGKYSIWLTLQEMLALVCSDVGYGCEDITRVCGSALNAVSVVDTTLSSLGVNIKVL